MLPHLGDDPGGYGAALIRRVLFEHMEPWSQSYAQRLTTVMRMYLRFLVSEGSIAAALVGAVPTVPQWRLSTLPRYILLVTSVNLTFVTTQNQTLLACR